MGNKVYIHGKSVRKSQLTARQREIEELLKEEKRLTHEWYQRMSRETPWGNRTRAEYQSFFDQISEAVKALEDNEASDWFSGLPSGALPHPGDSHRQ